MGAKVLLAHGADKGMLDWYGRTPLSWAGRATLGLLTSGAEVDQLAAADGKTGKKPDQFAGLREKAQTTPSAVHLANIERSLQASARGEECAKFDPKAKL